MRSVARPRRSSHVAASGNLEGLPARSLSPGSTERFAGANRPKVTIDYHAAQGRIGPGTVEPYSLRRSQQGNLLVFVVNDAGQIRSYRADGIHAVSVEPESFTPRYRVEF